MSATTADYAALCAAIDAGDDTALGPLADCLEELGDPRAAGLRARNPYLAPRKGEGGAKWGWERYSAPRHTSPFRYLPRTVFERLPPLSVIGRKGTPALWYPTRSAAYLALAAALIEV